VFSRTSASHCRDGLAELVALLGRRLLARGRRQLVDEGQQVRATSEATATDGHGA
jgi:hypothetical protein